MSNIELVLLPSSSPQAYSTSAKLSSTPPSHQRHVRINAAPAASIQAADDRKKTSAGALKSGSRAATIPASATVGFASASSLVKGRHFDLDINTENNNTQRAGTQSHSPMIIEDIEEEVKRPKKRTRKGVVAGEPMETKPKNPRARNPKKRKGETTENADNRPLEPAGDAVETKPKKPRARKPKNGKGKTTDTADCQTESTTTSTYFTPSAQGPELDPKKQRDTDEVFDIDEAVARKTDWTPVKDTNSAEKENNLAFSNMVTGFTMKDVGTTKKRRAESTNVSTKAPKKARTITGLVTGQSESNGTGSRTVPNAKKGVKSKNDAEKLLSPASAMLKLDQQDLLFGTSSQLASEESPSTLRHIQRAIEESERTEEQWSSTNYASHVWRVLEKRDAGKCHWSVSNRGEKGELLEMQSEVYLPEPDRTQDYALLMDGAGDDPPDRCNNADDSTKSFEGYIDEHFSSPPRSNKHAQSSFLDIDDFPTSAQPTHTESPSAESASLANPSSMAALTLGSPTKDRRKHHSKARSIFTAVKQTFSKIPVYKDSPKEGPKKGPPSTPPRAQHSGRYADVEEISDTEDDESLSPSPPRGRHRTDTASLPLVPAQSSLSSDMGSKVLGKSKVTKAGAEKEPDEVYLVHEKLLEWNAAKGGIFTRINCHIKTMRPSSDPSNPNWADKMHMHEPIILEDFTAYLTTPGAPLVGGIMTVHKRATKEQVKAWNQVRAAQGKMELVEKENHVFAVAKPLEVYMVKAWCQEASVTCIHRKDVKGRGGGHLKGLF